MSSVYYGWRMVVPISIVAYTLLVGICFTSFGMFVVPVSEDLGLSRADTNTALILVQVGMAVSAPVVGWLLDRAPIKPIMTAGALVTGASLATLGLSHSLWLSVIVLLVPLAAGLQGAALLSMNVLLVRWFKVYRGRAMTLGMLGMSFGGILVPPALSLAIGYGGWRFAVIACGVVVAGLLFPLFAIVRSAPRAGEVEVAAVPASFVQPRVAEPDRPLGIGTILKMPAFWTITLSSGFSIGVATATLVSLVPMGIGMGLTMLQAAALISANGFGALGGKLLIATFGDRVQRINLLTGLFVLLALVSAALLFSETYAVMLVAATGVGVCGAMSPVFFTLVADRFGMASFGIAQGLMLPVNSLLGALLLRFAGEVFDRTGGYDAMLVTFAVGQLVAAALLYSTGFFSRAPQAAATAGNAA